MGRRVLFSTCFCIGMLLVIFAVNFYFAEIRPGAPGTPQARLIQALAPLLGLVFVVPTFLFERSRVSQFRIEDNVLVLGRKSYPLQGLTEAVRDPKVLCRAIRRFGNGGLGSIRGRFWSRRLGKFEAFLTDTEKAVLLKWPDKIVAVSPADPEFFIYSARSAAGLK
jgi:hypothetical protein